MVNTWNLKIPRGDRSWTKRYIVHELHFVFEDIIFCRIFEGTVTVGYGIFQADIFWFTSQTEKGLIVSLNSILQHLQLLQYLCTKINYYSYFMTKLIYQDALEVWIVVLMLFILFKWMLTRVNMRYEFFIIWLFI